MLPTAESIPKPSAAVNVSSLPWQKNLPKHKLDDDKVDQHTMEDLESLALGTLYSEHLSEFSKVSA